ncbi:hypothetical protein CHUAL_004014 [Chamberlinius hualienensis]
MNFKSPSSSLHLAAAIVVTLMVISHWPEYCSAEIDYPPTIIRQPPADSLLFQVVTGPDEKEKPFILECEATGNPSPTYRWTKSGRNFSFQSYDNRISQQPGRGTLVVTTPRPEDEGYYQCFATNPYGTAVSNGVFVRRSDLGSFPDEQPKEVSVNEGLPLTLPCAPPTGFPKPNIFWIIQSRSGALRSINNSRITVDPEGALHFSNVTMFDSYEDAFYACSASLIFRNEYKMGNKVKLSVLSSGSSGVLSRHPPEVQYRSPPNIVSRRGEQQEIHCIFGGTPLPEIRWTKKNERLDNSRYTIINYGKTLRLKKVDAQDAGIYECTASNGVGSAQSWAVSITVQSAPYWITAPNNTNAAEEESVRFECKASGEPEPAVQWFVNGIPLANAKPNSNRKLINPTVMTIDRLSKQDTTVYQCNASNILGYAFKNFYLNVLSLEPEITLPPEASYETVDGFTATLRCRVFGAPQPEVKWLRNGKELTGGRYKIQQNGDLEVRGAQFADSGRYKCTARNKLGYVESPEELGQFDVRERTRITAEPEDYEVAAGNSATFRCSAVQDVNLKLEIDWLANDQLIDFDGDPRMYKGADYALTISKTTELDSGVYTCVAKTKLDNVTASATLIVQDRPNPPRLIGVECHQKTALIAWQQMGDNRAPILSSVIQYNTSFTPDTWEVAFDTVPASALKFEVSLSPWANYSFRVLARNKIGISLPSTHSTACETPPDVPYKNPEKVQGQGTTPNNLVITWTLMPKIDHNGPDFFYRVFWKRTTTMMDWVTENINNWEQTQFVVENQPTFQPYVIKVEAHNAKGQANVAAVEVMGYSGEDRPLVAPQNLEVIQVIDANTAQLRWSPVSPESVRGHFKGYKIQTWTRDDNQQNAQKLREVIVASNITSTPVNIFVPFSVNFVQVLVYNGRYDGPPSSPIRFETPEGKPGPVEVLEGAPLGSSALRLVWKRPRETNGRLLGYKLYYEQVDGTQLGPLIEREPAIDNPHATVGRISGLQRNTKYRVIIRAFTIAGLGESYFIELSTGGESKAPDKPTFTWVTLEPREGLAGILVTWQLKLEGHSGSHFFVQYRKRDETQFLKTKDILNDDSVAVTGLEPGIVYEVRIVAVDGKHHVESDIEEVQTVGAVSAPREAGILSNPGWFIGLMVAIFLLLAILIIVCLVKRNRGGKYSVHDKEAAQGRELDYPDESGFREYSKPPGGDGNNVKGSKNSLNSSIKHESDTDSMAEYGEGETGRFTEDGSFIGQYGKKRNEPDETSPSALATFV